jgi:VIT1/CCC1 family predicted Fe2+/Mn2+ transporter
MAAEQSRQRANTNPAAQLLAPQISWSRSLAVTAASVFFVSSAFPVVAAFVHDTAAWPKWWGVLDVVVAFVLALLAFAVLGFGRGKVDKPAEEASYRAYRMLLHGLFVLLMAFVFFGDRIVWSNCLTGLAWRAWLLLYCLPAWFTIIRATAVPAGPFGSAPS